MHPPPKSSSFPRLLAVRQLLVLVAAVMLLFGQSAAVGAVQTAGGTWIEVCAGSGTKMVQLGGETPTNDCSHCDYCTVSFSAASAGAPPFSLIGPAYGFAPVQHSHGPAVFVARAEQYWAANRGPPLISEVNMTKNTAPWAALTTLNPRGASWH